MTKKKKEKKKKRKKKCVKTEKFGVAGWSNPVAEEWFILIKS